MNKEYLVIPQSHDLNRGDQALVWESARLARDAGFDGSYYLMGEDDENIRQTKEEGFTPCAPILKHPSRVFKNKNNITYGSILKMQWGVVALFDLIFSLLLLFKPSRNLLKNLVSSKTKRTLDIYINVDAVFVKGGGFVHGYGGLVSTYYIYFVLYHIILAQKMKTPVYIFPNSFGPFKGPFVKFLVKKVLKNCEYVTARESISASMVEKELGINVSVRPDLGFFLEPSKKTEMKDYLIDLGVPLGSKECVAITMRPYRFPEYSDPKEAYMNYKNSMAEFINYISEKGYHIVLVEHTLSKNSHENDMSSIQDIIPQIKDSDYTIISDSTLTSREVKSLYSYCSYMIGTRFHSVIFSMAERVPAIAITYGGNKGQGIMNDIGIPEYAISINEINTNTLKKSFDHLTLHKKEAIHLIDSYLRKIEVDRNEMIKIIRK